MRAGNKLSMISDHSISFPGCMFSLCELVCVIIKFDIDSESAAATDRCATVTSTRSMQQSLQERTEKFPGGDRLIEAERSIEQQR